MLYYFDIKLPGIALFENTALTLHYINVALSDVALFVVAPFQYCDI